MSQHTPAFLLNRRHLLGAAAALAAGPVLAQAAYPSKPVRIVVPYPAGGATDTLARLVAAGLQAAWGQQVTVENKPGASGLIGGDLVAKSPPDGSTVLMGITAIIQLPAMKPKLPFDPIKDLIPLTEVARSNSFLTVPASLPVQNLKEFVAHVKAHPKTTTFGSYGNGTSAHIQGSLLNMQAGLDMVHVPYKGSAPLITDAIGGQVTAAFIDAASLAPHLKGGKLKVLAVTGSQRNKQLAPDTPTMLELGFKDFEPYGWFGMFMPAGTPADIVNKFATEAARVLRAPENTQRIEGLGLAPVGNTPQQFAKTVRDDAALYERIIRAADIRID